MHLILERPGAPPQRIKLDGDVALVGRAPDCDVIIDEEFVSKRHIRVMRGVVAVDLSTNGTFIDGERITGGALLRGHAMQVGRSQITLRVETEPESPTPSQPSSLIPAPRNASRPPPQAPELESLRRERESLAQELSTRKEECARLAADAQRADQEAAALRDEVASLRSQVAEADRAEEAAAAPTDQSAAGMLLFKLQRENAQLKKAFAELQSAPPVVSAPPPAAAASPQAAAPPQPDVAAAAGSDSVIPVARDAATPSAETPAPARAGSGAASSTALQRLATLVQQDVDAVEARLEDPLDAFLLVEGFRFLRRVERVVTRVAGGLIQLYQLHTMVPGVEGSLRELLAAAIENPNRTDVREELRGYLKELGRWLVVALGAYRKAAESYALQLKEELSEEALVAKDPIPMLKRVSGKAEAELWRRANSHLRDLNPDRVSEFVEKLARDAASQLSEGAEPEEFS